MLSRVPYLYLIGLCGIMYGSKDILIRTEPGGNGLTARGRPCAAKHVVIIDTHQKHDLSMRE